MIKSTAKFLLMGLLIATFSIQACKKEASVEPQQMAEVVMGTAVGNGKTKTNGTAVGNGKTKTDGTAVGNGKK